MKLMTLQDAYTANTLIVTITILVAQIIEVIAIHVAMPALGTCNVEYMT